MISRRGFLGGLIAAPAIVRVGSLMPIRSFVDEFRMTDLRITGWKPFYGTLENLFQFRDALAPGVIYTAVRYDTSINRIGWIGA